MTTVKTSEISPQFLPPPADPLTSWVGRRGAVFGVRSWGGWPLCAPPEAGVLWAVLVESEYAELGNLVAAAERDGSFEARERLAVRADWLQAKGARAGVWVAAYLAGSDAYVSEMKQALASVPRGSAYAEGSSVYVVVWVADEQQIRVRFSMNHRRVEDSAVEAQLLRVLQNKLALVLSEQPRLRLHERDRFQAMAERCAYRSVDAVFGRAFLPEWTGPVELAGELRPAPVAVRGRWLGETPAEGWGFEAEYLLGTKIAVPACEEPAREIERARKAAAGLPL